MSDQLVKNRPLLCLVNGTHEEAIQGGLERDYRIAALDLVRVPELLAQFDAIQPDCVVIFSGAHAAKSIEHAEDWASFREYCEMRYIPIVCLTGEEGEEFQNAILADAFFPAPVETRGLQLQVKKLIERRYRILDQIQVDPVTGAFNYRYLQRQVQLQLDDMKRSYEAFSMVSIQLDHPAEDPNARQAWTKKLVDFITKSIRPTDCLAHDAQGGLILVLPKTVKEDAIKLMRRLTSMFAETPVDTPHGAESVTFSAMVREFVDASKSAEECLALMAFSAETNSNHRSGLVLDGEEWDENSAQTRKLMVAIIDDDRLIREMLQHQLSDIGENGYDAEIKTFADGEEFFNDPWHRQNERYLVIVDRIMPRIDGLEVLRKIRTGYDRRRYVCFMLSSRGAEADIALALQSGANDYMVKPFSLRELRVRINRLIGGWR